MKEHGQPAHRSYLPGRRAGQEDDKIAVGYWRHWKWEEFTIVEEQIGLSSGDPSFRDEWMHLRFRPMKYLPDPRDLPQDSLTDDERAKLVAFLRRGTTLVAWKGYSSCRFPDCWVAHKESRMLGTKCLTAGVYKWPEGLAHYVEVHRVSLPDHFVAFALSST